MFRNTEFTYLLITLCRIGQGKLLCLIKVNPFSLFYTILACDRHTDTVHRHQPTGNTMLAYYYMGKK